MDTNGKTWINTSKFFDCQNNIEKGASMALIESRNFNTHCSQGKKFMQKCQGDGCRVGTRRGTLLPCSECPPPNYTCSFHCMQLSSIIGLVPSENVIPCVSGDALRADLCDKFDRGPRFCAAGRP